MQLGLGGDWGNPAQANPLRPSKPMMGLPVNGGAVLGEGETAALLHAKQTTLRLTRKAAVTYLMCPSFLSKKTQSIIRNVASRIVHAGSPARITGPIGGTGEL
jgi:hypothetical protein